jgi:hypothetical protein
MWYLICNVSLSVRENAFEQCVHLYGLSPVWILLCRSKSFRYAANIQNADIYFQITNKGTSICSEHY